LDQQHDKILDLIECLLTVLPSDDVKDHSLDEIILLSAFLLSLWVLSM
jgi:hypothetical protein